MIAASMAGHHASMVAAKRCTSGEVEVAACSYSAHSRSRMSARSGLVPDSASRARRRSYACRISMLGSPASIRAFHSFANAGGVQAFVGDE